MDDLNLYLFSNFVSKKYPSFDSKQQSNMKYRIKKSWNNETCKIVLEYKKYVKEHQSIESENVKLDCMTETEREEFLSNENLKKIKEIQKNKIILKKKYNKYFKEKNIPNEKAFEKLYTLGESVKICNLTPEFIDTNNDEALLLDGRTTFTLKYRIEYDETFDSRFHLMYKSFIKKNVELTCDYDDFISILTPYYDYVRTEFEKNLILESNDWRKQELEMMPKREKGMTYSQWLKKMGECGFYCGYCDVDYYGPVSDPDAWVFIGKKLIREMNKIRDDWAKNHKPVKSFLNYDDTPINNDKYKVDFMELNVSPDNLEYSFSGYNPWNINYHQVDYMEKRFKNNFINLRLHQKLINFGKE